MNYCYERGYDFGGLYKIFKRVSCWCCPLQSFAELRKLYENFPDLWQKLKSWDGKTDMPFRQNYSVEMLEARFNLEADREKLGLTNNPHTKEFRTALKEVLKNYDLGCDRIK